MPEAAERAAIGHSPRTDLKPSRRDAYLIFDQVHRVIHASTSLRAVLRLPAEISIVGEAVSNLLAAAAGVETETSQAVKKWLPRLDQATVQSSETGAPLLLLTTIGARSLQGNLIPIGEQYWLATFEDVTAGLSAESEMLAIANRDLLTGIGNRALFEQRLDEALAGLTAEEVDRVTVLFLDLDRFKTVNDTLGHAVGDGLLCLVSERLQSSLRETDTLARLGGDEFAILLAASAGKEVASVLASRIIDLIQRPYLIQGHVINVGVSIGIAEAPVDGSSRDQLLRSADLALYHSKAAGRGVFHFFKPAMEEKAQRRRTLELELRKALLLRQFELHYQSEIEAETQTIIGLEGLLRWRHPVRGLLLPEEFIELAEEIGMAMPIGDWALRTACREAMRWPDHVSMAVNASPLQFETGKFAASVERALVATKLPARRLEIEVTENILQRNGPTVLATLEALHALGVRVAMDSFGTGLASLSQLVNFPFDKIKIDPSLMGADQDDAKNRAIVRAISVLGQSLGISTLAEGVENSEHLAHIRLEGCQSLQGFYYSKAVPSGDLDNLVLSLSPDPSPLTSNEG